MNRKIARFLSLLFPFILLMALLPGCAPRIPTPVALVDNPEHSYNNGMKFLERGEYEWALAEFERALVLDPQFSLAYVGIGLVKGAKGDFDAAFNALTKAKELNGGQASVGIIRLNTLQKADGWITRAEAEFEAARQKHSRDPSLYYYMGIAYKEALELKKALSMFQRVQELGAGYLAEAKLETYLVDRVIRAQPRSEIGRQMVLKDRLNRMDVALLLLEEGEVEKILQERSPKSSGSPGPQPLQSKARLVDLLDHPNRGKVETVLSLKIRGLEHFPDLTFSPNHPVSRAEYAIILEDIFLKATGDDDLGTRYLNEPSPFEDVDPSSYAFNAIMLLTRKAVLEAKSYNLFEPEKPVNGPDALLALRRLSEEIKLR